MIKLHTFILESVHTTNNNAQRRKELEEWLKDKKYPDYVKTLNKMMDDPKAAVLIKDGFGGDLGNSKFTFSVKKIKAKALRPTQSEIDIDKSLKHALNTPSNMENDFKKEVIIANMPLVTFRGNYVIDGHHRWAEEAIINPDGKMVCFDYDNPDISPIQMLKAVQASIAAALVVQKRNNEDLPIGITKGQNLYDDKWDKNQIREYVEEKLTDICAKIFEKHTGEDAVDTITNNAVSVKNNQYPEAGAPNRGEMPQTDKAGTEKGNKRSSYPDKKDSALYIMRKGKFDSAAVK